MKMRSNRSQIIRRIIVSALALLSIMITSIPMTAVTYAQPVKDTTNSDVGYNDDFGFANYLSLTGIERLKTSLESSDEIFEILEIVPEEYSGSIGYYVTGQEPINWESLVKVEDNGTIDYSKLEKYINNLKDSGILGDNSSEIETPLTMCGTTTEPYKEFEAWDQNLPQDYFEVLLKDEKKDTDSKIKFAPDEDGSFSLDIAVQIDTVKDTNSAQLVRELIKLTDTASINKITEMQGDYNYYYKPEWKTLDTNSNNSVDEHKEKYFYNENYEFLGILGYGFNVEFGKTYKYVESYGKPKLLNEIPAGEESDYFLAVNGGFEESPEAESYGYTAKYFNLEKEIYTYQGKGKGQYSPTGESTTKTVEVRSNKLLVQPFVNNNWFAKYVLDLQTPEEINDMKIRVNSITPDQVDEISIESADLIVISNGFDLNNIDPSKIGNSMAEKYSKNNDISNDIKEILVEAILPEDDGNHENEILIGKSCVVFDDKNRGDASNLNSLIKEIKDVNSSTDGFVQDNIFYCKQDDIVFVTPDTNNVGSALLTPEFHNEYQSGTSFATKNAEVLRTIGHENALRSISNIRLLPEYVSMATCIRHTLNAQNPLVENKKTSIKVLEIQPLSGTASSIYQGTPSNNVVTVDKVKNWLPNDVEVDKLTIEIETMSVAEFNGKIEDISEVYDLIYIGAETGGLNMSYGKTNYNDNSMDGLIYTNIGDTYTVNTGMGGMLDTDYGSDKTHVYNNTQARFTGIDITPNKMKELTEFANSGFPIILDNDLQTGLKLNVEIPVEYELTIGRNDHPEKVSGKVIADNIKYVNEKGEDVTNQYKSQIDSSRFEFAWERWDRYDNVIKEQWMGINFFDSVSDNREKFARNKYSLTITDMDSGNVFSNLCNTICEGWWKGQYYISNEKDTAEFNIVVPLYSESINTDRVDNCSYVYETFMGDPRTNEGQCEGILNKTNVMFESDIANNQSLFVTYLNHAKPTINATSVPAEFKGIQYEGGKAQQLESCVTNQTLEFVIEIDNPTDPTPEQTRYKTVLYIDQNADGRFGIDETISALQVRDITADHAESDENLRADHEYKISRKLPENLIGSIAWKLEFVKVGADHVHNAIDGITFIKPKEPQVLNILQVCPDDGIRITESNQFKDKFDELEDLGLYDVNITLIPHNALKYDMSKLDAAINYADLDTMDSNGKSKFVNAYDKYMGYLYRANEWTIRYHPLNTGNMNNNDILHTSEQVFNIFNQYSMVIIGFAESFGRFETDGLSEASATALKNYINSGRAVLFSHDSTSQFNQSDVTIDNDWYHQYYMNTIARDALGLDRYGITNTINNFLKKGLGITDSSMIAELSENKNYSVAYKPKSGRTETVPQVQGYLDYLMQWRLGNWNELKSTSNTVVNNFAGANAIKQLNKGQITSFPYDINVSDFEDGANATHTIDFTHSQYYQLNMNAEDVTVWYTLSSDAIDKTNEKDPANAYYIFNKGNVTYTGAGHSALDYTTLSDLEVKLFVNTMIAAYRVAVTAPGFEYKDEDSLQSMESYYVPAQVSQNGSSVDLLGVSKSELLIPFIIHDRNFSEERTIDLVPYYRIGTGEWQPIPDNDFIDKSGTPFANQSLEFETYYKFQVPQCVLNALNSEHSIDIKIDSIISVGDESNTTESIIKVVKLGFLPLK